MKRPRPEPEALAADGRVDRPDLVTFNVSGKIYTVLFEPTLSLHPNSLLTQLAEEKQMEKDIFVEGDQDLFKYVLEYHRDRKIILPPTVSKEAVLREVKRFGLDVGSEEIVEDGVHIPSFTKRLKAEQARLSVQERENRSALLMNMYAQAMLELSKDTGDKQFNVSCQNVLLKLGKDADAIGRFLRSYDHPCFVQLIQSWALTVGYSTTVSETGKNLTVTFKPIT